MARKVMHAFVKVAGGEHWNSSAKTLDVVQLATLLYLLAPQRPPGNISWTFSSSSISIKWDPVVAKADESAVTGYKVLVT